MRVVVAKASHARADVVSLWEIYRFSYSLALRSLSWRHAKQVLRLVLEPCAYWRNVEVPAVVNHLGVRPGDRILDIGSPKIASLYLCYRMGVEVYATDLYPYFFDEYSHYLRCLRSSPSGASYHIELQDARCLTYPDCYFDKVYAISVVEHIEDESLAMGEIARVLKPGGLCCLTVPFAACYYESTIDHEIYYKKPVDGKPVFFERHYNARALQTRLVAPSGLRLTAMEYYGERWVPFERVYWRLPRLPRMALSILGPFFSRLFLYRVSQDSLGSARAALLVLRKDLNAK